MRGEVLASSGGSDSVALAFDATGQNVEKAVDIYVDESGNFSDSRELARYCVITLVFHSPSSADAEHERRYRDGIFRLGADPDSMIFHASPLVRQEGQFSATSRNMRGKLFYQMLSFVRLCSLEYACFIVDTAYADSPERIADNIGKQIHSFMANRHGHFVDCPHARLFYDAGQKSVTRILDSVIELLPCPVDVVQGVRQADHLMMQVADFICTVKLIERRVSDGIPFNNSEQRFFGSPRDFKRNVLKKIKAKEI